MVTNIIPLKCETEASLKKATRSTSIAHSPPCWRWGACSMTREITLGIKMTKKQSQRTWEFLNCVWNTLKAKFHLIWLITTSVLARVVSAAIEKKVRAWNISSYRARSCQTKWFHCLMLRSSGDPPQPAHRERGGRNGETQDPRWINRFKIRKRVPTWANERRSDTLW